MNRFQRQATEWGRSYKFRSCADIRLVESLANTGDQQGGGHGEWVNGEQKHKNICCLLKNICGLFVGVCLCEPLREGARCQYETQCQSDTDCNGPKGQGRCEQY